MRFSSALISFLPSLPLTSVAMAMEEPHDSVLHDVTASILEESIEVKYKSKRSRLEPLKIQNSIDGRPNKANDVELADDKGDITQKKELLHHLVDHQQHQEGKSLEECNVSPTAAAAANAAATSDDDSLMKRNFFLDKESIQKMALGHLNRGTCSSPNDACVPQHKAIEGNGAFLEPEDASYASSGYCVPLYTLEDMEYKNVVANTLSLVDKQEFNKEEEMTDSYYHYHPQYDEHHRQLDSLDCTSECSSRLDVSSYDGPFFSLTDCYVYGDCKTDYPDISCWNTTGITDMYYAFYFYEDDLFNAPLECWDVGKVTSMYQMFSYTNSFNQPIDSWDVSQVEDMEGMFSGASSFNQPLATWDVSQVEDMKYMFYGLKIFNQSIGSWNVSQVEDIKGMFSGATSFNQPIGSWDVSQVTDMYGTFYYAKNFNQSIDSWNVSKVEDMRQMFNFANYFNQPIGSWDVSQVEDMRFMFANAYFNQPIDSWDVSQVEDMGFMFNSAYSFNQCLSTWAEKTSDIVDTFDMLDETDCPNGIGSPNATIGPWCQNYTQGCFAPGFEPSQQPSDLPSNSPTTKSQKKKKIKKTKKQDKKKSKKM